MYFPEYSVSTWRAHGGDIPSLVKKIIPTCSKGENLSFDRKRQHRQTNILSLMLFNGQIISFRGTMAIVHCHPSGWGVGLPTPTHQPTGVQPPPTQGHRPTALPHGTRRGCHHYAACPG